MKTKDKPIPIFNPDGLPEQFRRDDQRFIITWCAKPDPEKGKIGKVPGFRNEAGQIIARSVADPRNLMTYSEALKVVNDGLADGIGLSVHPDSGSPYSLVDVDDPTHPTAIELLEEARQRGAYVQRSVSGRGFHIIGRGLGTPTSGGAQAIDVIRTFSVLTGIDASGNPNIGTQDLLDRAYEAMTGERASSAERTKNPLIPPRPNIGAVWAKLRPEIQKRMTAGYPEMTDGSAIARKAAIELRQEGLDAPEIACILSEPGLPVSEKALRNRSSVRGAYQWAYQYQALRAVAEMPAPEAVFQSYTGATTAHRPLFIDAADLVNQPEIEINYLIDGLIETATVGMGFGDIGTAKTFTAVDMALSVGFGIPWMGRPTKQGRVLYFNGEGHGGMKRRIKAWLKYHGFDSIEPGVFTLSQRRVELTERSVGALEAEIQAIVAQHGPLSLVVIDTLSRHIESGKNENAAVDMAGFINTADFLRDQFGAAVLIVHHSGKGDQNSGRGSNSLKAACDWEFRVAPGEIKFTKLKEDELPPPFGFRLEQVPLSEKVGSAVPVQCQYDPTGGRAPGLSGDARQLLSTLQMGLSEPDGKVTRKELRRRFYEALGVDVSPNTKTQKFSRSEDTLLKTGVIRIEGDNVVCAVLSPVETIE